MSYPDGPTDPLAALLRAEKALLEAGARGERVAMELVEVRGSIRALIESRERENEGGRRR